MSVSFILCFMSFRTSFSVFEDIRNKASFPQFNPLFSEFVIHYDKKHTISLPNSPFFLFLNVIFQNRL